MYDVSQRRTETKTIVLDFDFFSHINFRLYHDAIDLITNLINKKYIFNYLSEFQRELTNRDNVSISAPISRSHLYHACNFILLG